MGGGGGGGGGAANIDKKPFNVPTILAMLARSSQLVDVAQQLVWWPLDFSRISFGEARRESPHFKQAQNSIVCFNSASSILRKTG